MQKNKFNVKKYFGQNFLMNEEIKNKIINFSHIDLETHIIEIGPGLGALTEKMIDKCGKLTAIEIDKTLIPILKKKFEFKNNFEIINKDILKINLKEIIDINYNKMKIIANLPYYITTPIITMILESEIKFDSITLMVQKEVAQRFLGKNKNSGAITFFVNYYSDVEWVCDVPKEDFFPVPKVDSCVINFKILSNKKVFPKDEKLMFDIIKLAFLNRRKTFSNCLNNNFNMNKKDIENILQKFEIRKDIRGENLTLQNFSDISDYVVENFIKKVL